MSAANRASQDVTTSVVLSRVALRTLLELHRRDHGRGFDGVARVVVAFESKAFIEALDELLAANLIAFVNGADRPSSELWFSIPIDLRRAP